MPKRITFHNLITEAVSLCGGLDISAEVMNVSRATVNRWRQSGKIPNISAAAKISGKIGWPLEWFAIGRKSEI